MSKEKEQPSTQWHPLFAELLRPMLQDYYDVQTNFPVGDVPRQADIVVLRRTSAEPLPFRGLWRHLTPWNGWYYLVSNSTVPVERDSVPVHLVAEEPIENLQTVIRVVADDQRLWEMYSSWLATTNPKLLQEVAAMAQKKHKGPQFDIGYAVKEIGASSTMEQTIKTLGVEAVLAALKEEKLLKKLSSEDRQKLKDSLK